MPNIPIIDWAKVVALLIELIKLLAPLFSDKDSRHRIERAITSLRVLQKNKCEEPLHRIFCAVLQPTLSKSTKTALDEFDQVMPKAPDWEKVLLAFVAFLKFLLELFAPDDDDEPDDPPDDLVNYTVVTARATVTRYQLDRHAKGLSDILDDHADPMVTPDDLETTELREIVRNQITTSLSADASEWFDFSAAMDAALDRLADKGLLQTIALYRAAYHDISKGLKQA